MVLTNLLDPDETEEIEFHILVDHLKVDQARCLTLAQPAHQPFTEAFIAFMVQPRQLALEEEEHNPSTGWAVNNYG